MTEMEATEAIESEWWDQLLNGCPQGGLDGANGNVELQQQQFERVTSPAIDLGMVGNGREQVDASANTVGMLGDGAEHADASSTEHADASSTVEGIVGDGDNRDAAEHVAASAGPDCTSDNNARKNRSEEQNHFIIIPEHGTADCKHCGKVIRWGHGTTNLRKHRKSKACKKKSAAFGRLRQDVQGDMFAASSRARKNKCRACKNEKPGKGKCRACGVELHDG